MLASNRSPNQRTQGRLLTLAALFLLVYSVALTLSPAARARSWQVSFRWEHWIGYGVWIILVALAHRQTARFLPDRDPYLLPATSLLSGWGLLTIWRLFPYYGQRQTMWLLIGVIIFILGLRLPTDLNFLRRYKYVWLTGGLLLTALTLFLGTTPLGYGPRMWLGCCGLYFQPSEPLKLLLIIYLAAFLADRRSYFMPNPIRKNGTQGSASLLPLLAPTIFMAGLAMVLLLIQRDLGTATIFLFLYTAIVYVASREWRILVAGGLTILLAALAGFALFDVVRIRVDAWINPWIDPSGGSYQIVQSLLAVANGGIFGRGPGMGSPTLVPVPHSDFIFAAIMEESGLIGALGLLLLVALIASRGLRTALRAPDYFRRLLATGLTIQLVAQSILIIGGNLRMLPLTGVTLPFVSYGGSSLLTSFLSLLVLMHISNREKYREPAPIVNPRSYMELGAFLTAGIGAVALVSGYWSFIRGPALLLRTDNPRRAVTSQWVRRGSILDSQNNALAASTDQPGEITRVVKYPPLSPIIGYTHTVFGQSGIEDTMDDYLRGLRGNPGLLIWWNHLLYGQPPPGIDVRLSLSLDLQRSTDELLGDHAGALVLLNAENGEIMAMASHPAFDANQLDQNWETLISDPQSPLLNRATLGRYPHGNIGEALSQGEIAESPMSASPLMRLPTGADSSPINPSLSPLQVALVAAALSNQGVSPAPHLVVAVDTSQSGWVILPPEGEQTRLLSEGGADSRLQALSVGDDLLWQTLAVAPNGPDGFVTWYAGGTTPEWSGAPMAISVLLEEDNPGLAEEIGQTVLQRATLGK